MANVYFKKGTQAALNALKNDVEVNKTKSYVEGSFYLTNDTDRLYFAQSNSELVYLNRGVQVVDTLPTTGMQDGDIYYIPSSNILAIYDNDENSGPSHWTQINPDTDTQLTSSTSAISVSTTTNGAVITSSVSDQKGNTVSGNFTIVGSNGTSVTRTDNVVTISSDTYSLEVGNDTTTSQGVIRLSSSSTTSEVIIEAGAGIGLTKDENKITLSSSGGLGSVSHSAAASDTSVNVITTIADDLGGSITSTPVHYVITQASTSAAPFASYSTSTTDNGIILNTSINAYTKAEVDEKIAAELQVANALTYKGTIASQEEARLKIGQLSNTAQGLYFGKVGDVYKISAASILEPVSAKQGDLVIAYTEVEVGEEDEQTGEIETGDDKVKWEVVPSGDEQIISGIAGGDAINGYFMEIKDNSPTPTLGKITLKAGDHITFSDTATNNGQLALTINHGNADAGTAVSSTTSAVISNTALNVVTGFNLDDKGHVSNVQIGNYTFSSPTLSGGSSISTTTTNLFTGTITNNVNGSTGSIRFILQSSDLNISSTATTIDDQVIPVYNMNLEWGNFDDI